MSSIPNVKKDEMKEQRRKNQKKNRFVIKYKGNETKNKSETEMKLVNEKIKDLHQSIELMINKYNDLSDFVESLADIVIRKNETVKG